MAHMPQLTENDSHELLALTRWAAGCKPPPPGYWLEPSLAWPMHNQICFPQRWNSRAAEPNRSEWGVAGSTSCQWTWLQRDDVQTRNL